MVVVKKNSPTKKSRRYKNRAQRKSANSGEQGGKFSKKTFPVKHGTGTLKDL